MEQRGVLTATSDLSSVIAQFPPSFDLAFGYGSGVFSQSASSSSSATPSKLPPPASELPMLDLPMLDLIFAVPDLADYHSRLLSRHPEHYPLLPRLLPPSLLASLTSGAGAGMWFNPLCSLPPSPRLLKYGLISTPQLVDDLTNWTHLYAAGRLQKPVAIPSPPPSPELQSALSSNLSSALAAGLLTLPPPQFSSKLPSATRTLALRDLFLSVAQLSYGGDPRMGAGAEDPDKVRKLVGSEGAMERWVGVYGGRLREMEGGGLIEWNEGGGTVSWEEGSGAARREMLARVPGRVARATGGDASGKAVAKALAGIVGGSARTQALKGVFTAGLARSAVYAAAKLRKGALRKK
ncbi:hypothetical protein TeGR_g2594 [Tetraparma gracilis]|uniref:Phosphatidate cytidylyltransferase, mitochondrial n=1 Tax=Tetraparma gracilis TaxID=2962635 RepID=A0ABQ6M5B3_9STRA|nr:hypothetical protein TeGR_g2594 [Tetraparma gracilis]